MKTLIKIATAVLFFATLCSAQTHITLHVTEVRTDPGDYGTHFYTLFSHSKTAAYSLLTLCKPVSTIACVVPETGSTYDAIENGDQLAFATPVPFTSTFGYTVVAKTPIIPLHVTEINIIEDGDCYLVIARSQTSTYKLETCSDGSTLPFLPKTGYVYGVIRDSSTMTFADSFAATWGTYLILTEKEIQ